MVMSSSNSTPLPIKVFCNGVPENKCKKRKCVKKSLEYRQMQDSPKNVQLSLDNFINSVFHLPDKIQDLLEIAAYIFCADRKSPRGKRDNLEYNSWARDFEFHVKVRDYKFWTRPEVQEKMSEALTWMSGDKCYNFVFYPGHDTGRAGLFDKKCYSLPVEAKSKVILFSGGLDSLSGVFDQLYNNSDILWLISHNSRNPSTKLTQKSLVENLEKRFPGRINHRYFDCHLHGKLRAPEESQRTRAFLYCTMGFALSYALKQKKLIIYENGITALNFSKRGAMFNARASRTAHPKTIRRMKKFLSLVLGDDFSIETPFSNKTKTDIVNLIKKYNELGIIDSSVSCSRTYNKIGAATHCGQCSQCIDRRFAMYAANCQGDDEGGIYSFDFINQGIDNGEVKTHIIDFLRQAQFFFNTNVDNFNVRMMHQLSDAIDFDYDDNEQVIKIHDLCKRHGAQIQEAIPRMVKPFVQYPESSLSTIIGKKEFLKSPAYSFAKVLSSEIEEFIRRAYAKEKPPNENDLNLKVHGFLSGHSERFKREHPSLSFATARVVPDHSSLTNYDLLLESKYLRNSTTPSVATEGIAADLTKYPDQPLKLFIVYDPFGTISNRDDFKADFERKRHCIIHII